MFPWEGPPLPRITGLTWANLKSGQGSLLNSNSTQTSDISSYLFSSKSRSNIAPEQTQAMTTYVNTETVEFPDGFDPVTYMPKKIVIHRNAKVAK